MKGPAPKADYGAVIRDMASGAPARVVARNHNLTARRCYQIARKAGVRRSLDMREQWRREQWGKMA